MGFEPTTTGITIRDSTVELRSPLYRCSLRLMLYARFLPLLQSLRGLPGGTRTHNPQLRRLVLYPVELRAARPGIVPRRNSSPGHTNGLVGVRGFEPPTSCSQSKRATRLRHTPKKAPNDTLSSCAGQRKLLA